MNNLFLLFVLILIVPINIWGQKEILIRRPIVNGMASKLPIPDYPQEAKDFCVNGKVEVEILIGEDGKVLEANAISGEELLYHSAVEAAKQAVFRQIVDAAPVKKIGILVYNFVPEKKCIGVGIVNKKALSIPKPKIKNLKSLIKQEETVEVRILIESNSGRVLRAKAISGNLMLRPACENSAGQSKFVSINDVPDLSINAILIYKFKPNGKIEF